MRIIMSDAPKDFIRSEQCGDWDYNATTIMSFVRDDCSDDSKLAVLIHELVEAYLCRRSGILDEDVVAFDDKYEKERICGKHSKLAEPGDAEDSPYRQEHMAATHVERAVCSALGISWEAHDKEVTK